MVRHGALADKPVPDLNVHVSALPPPKVFPEAKFSNFASPPRKGEGNGAAGNNVSLSEAVKHHWCSSPTENDGGMTHSF